MVRHVVPERTRLGIISRAACWSGLAALLALSLHSAEINPVKPPVPGVTPKPAAGPEKPKGPEHNVTLMEEPGVLDLFNKAAKARARAEKEPEAWPDCVKCYADILKKYPNTVYLDKWEGTDKEHPLGAYKNGLYKSTRERVAAEIASLPPAALTVYRVINESAARALFLEGQQQFDEHKMEQLARDYFQTSWSNDALAWLGEVSYERGAGRDAAERLRKASANPGNAATAMSVLARLLLAQVHSGDKTSAAKTLALIEEALKDPAKGALRIGSVEGPAAVSKLKARVDALPAIASTDSTDANGDWQTYFGNASHTQTAQARESRGLRKWSLRINELLYGKNAVASDNDKLVGEDGTAVQDQSINQQLTVKDGFFYLNNGQVYTGYPIANPVPGSTITKETGTARYTLPAENAKTPPATTAKATRININSGQVPAQPSVVQHPYFSTLANGRAYGILGVESFAAGFNNQRGFFRMGRNGGADDAKILGPSNYPVCIGRAKEGSAPSILWSLKPGDPAFVSHSKADQDWLKSAYFVSTPTHESGVLYSMAVVMPPAMENQSAPIDAWAVAIDADNGQMLWHTQICTSTPVHFGMGLPSDVQPDRGLPVAVANRTVFVVTNLGAVAALDAGVGGVKWIRVYDRIKTAPDQMMNMGETAPGHDFWAPNPPIVYRTRLIVTPQDSDSIYAYDIETGARVWEKDPAKDNVTPPQGRYKHVLGIVKGALVLTGKDILFVNALNGKNLADTIPVDSTIKGRGAVTDSMAWISTEKDMLSIRVANDGGKYTFSEPKSYKWTDPKVEAGSVYSAGGVLLTVSHTHVNAFIIWEELEAKLLDRLKAEPDNVPAHIELSDIYKSIERYDPALAELEKARTIAAKAGASGKTDDNLRTIDTRKFEALMSLGEQLRLASKASEAIATFQKAYAIAVMPGMADVLPVTALNAQAALFESSGNLAAAVQAYQSMIVKHGNAVLTDKPQTSKMARLYAQMKLAELKAKDPASVAAIDTEAKTAFADAGTDPKKLERIVTQFPNSDFASIAQLSMARLDVEKAPDRARLNALRVISRPTTAANSAQALAILAVACERAGLLSAAHDALTRLASNDDFKTVKASLAGVDPKAAAGDVVLSEWAAARLKETAFLRAPSQAIFAIGPGKLSETPAWTKSVGEGSTPLIPDGIPPMEMRRAIFTIEPHNELSAVSGRDGLELWKPRPTAPPNSHGRSFWWDRLLIICGESSIVAYDSSENGKVAWTQELKIDRVSDAGYWAQINGDRLIVAHSGNTLQGFDAQSGAMLWQKQLTASQMNFTPACGDGYIVVATANSNKLTAFNLETGGENWSADVAELRTWPVVSDDRVIAAQRTGKLIVLDGKTGKRIGADIVMESPATTLRAAGELAIVLAENHNIVAYHTDPSKAGKAWQALLPTSSTVTDYVIDGDDLLVTSSLTQIKYEMTAYSIKSQGKIKWKQEMATDAALQMAQVQRGNNGRAQANNFNGNVRVIGNGRLVINGQIMQINNNGAVIDEGAANFVYGSDGSGGWVRENVARDALIVMQSLWDVSGAQSKGAALIDRQTGKAIWSTHLKAEMSGDGTIPVPRIQFFDGGLVVSEQQSRSAFYAARAGGNDDDIKNIAAEAAKNPSDIDLLVKLAAAVFEKGDREKGLADLAAILSDPKTNESGFAQAYTQMSLLRKTLASQQHTTLAFQRVDKAPDLAGGSAGWETVAEKTFDAWKDVYLASDDAASRLQPKKELWRGPADLSASFKGAYDDANLYIQIAVKDDQHKNEQAGSNIDFGDSVRLAFDIDLDGGTGYRGKTFELSLGLGKGGAAQGWKRVENHLFLKGVHPLEKDFSVTRKEADKLTLYQIALPLAYLGLENVPGKPFGFTFAAQDLDAGTQIEKIIGPSPGVMNREPRLFSRGVLEAKK